MRVPVSAAMALASAGAAVGTLTSPTPVGGSSESMRWISIAGDRLHAHDRVAVEVLGDDVAAVAEDDLAPGGRAQREQQPAFNLGADEVGVDGDAAVEGEHDALDVDASSVVE